jgi:hypothetical protein
VSELNLTLFKNVEVDHFISETTCIPNAFRLSVKLWCPIHLWAGIRVDGSTKGSTSSLYISKVHLTKVVRRRVPLSTTTAVQVKCMNEDSFYLRSDIMNWRLT